MIIPVSYSVGNNKTNYNYFLNSNLKKIADCGKAVPETNLSGANSPIKSYVSFGWCTGHYQAMYEIDTKFSEKFQTKLKQFDVLKYQNAKRIERYSLVDNASIMAAKILAQYSNLQCVVAEIPPSYAIMTAKEMKKAMGDSSIYNDPISLLIGINAINNMNAKNENLDANHLERGKGATQLYSTAIILNQIEQNIDKNPKDKSEIKELVSIVKNNLKEIYGSDIFNKIEYFASMGENPTDKQKRQALDFLIEVDNKAKEMNLPEEFEFKLNELINKVNERDNLKEALIQAKFEGFSIKINYPDHDHTYAHAHNIPHSHEHQHTHSEYEDIMNNKNKKLNKTNMQNTNGGIQNEIND